MKLNTLTIKQAAKGLQNGDFTSVDLTKACLDRIRGADGRVKACLTVSENRALAVAQEADVRRQAGGSSALLGVPYLAKDNIMTKGERTTAASKILADYVAPYDATVVRKLNDAGAVMLGKTNLDEFAHGVSTENSAFGPTHNPWDLKCVPGGSSGGSAAAVAADMCLFALGTDTGGSIRHPASFCGVTGLKPTYGRASRHGLIAMTSSTDVPGSLTKTAEDAAIVLGAIAGEDALDATSAGCEVGNYADCLKNEPLPSRIGLPREFFTDKLHTDVRASLTEATAVFRDMGVECVDISLPHTEYGVAAYYIITPSEISSNLSRFDGIKYGLSETGAKDLGGVYLRSRGRGFGSEAKRRIMLGTFALSSGYFDAYYLRAQKIRTVITRELERELSGVDVILTPSTPHPAFKLGGKADPLAMYLEDIFMAGASLAGLPAISLPCGFSGKLPVGLQLIGRRFGETDLLKLAYAYQEETDWHRRKPDLLI